MAFCRIGPRRDSQFGGMMPVPMPDRILTCPRCGTEWPCLESFYLRNAGRTVTRWCTSCKRLFDVDIPSTHIAPLAERDSNPN